MFQIDICQPLFLLYSRTSPAINKNLLLFLFYNRYQMYLFAWLVLLICACNRTIIKQSKLIKLLIILFYSKSGNVKSMMINVIHDLNCLVIAYNKTLFVKIYHFFLQILQNSSRNVSSSQFQGYYCLICLLKFNR